MEENKKKTAKCKMKEKKKNCTTAHVSIVCIHLYYREKKAPKKCSPNINLYFKCASCMSNVDFDRMFKIHPQLLSFLLFFFLAMSAVYSVKLFKISLNSVNTATKCKKKKEEKEEYISI